MPPSSTSSLRLVSFAGLESKKSWSSWTGKGIHQGMPPLEPDIPAASNAAAYVKLWGCWQELLGSTGVLDNEAMMASSSGSRI